MKENKEKVLKTLFILSFIPYILIIIYGVYGFIFGGNRICIDTCSPSVYGVEAFLDNVFIGGLTLTIYGVIPISIVYEILFIIIS